MTIASATSRIGYTGDGVSTAFAVPFFFSANSDLVVSFQDLSGNVTTKLLGTDYNLTGATVSTGGTCTFVVAPTTGFKIAITRVPPITQTTSYNNNDPFPAKSHENALDKLTTIDQYLKSQIDRAILVAPTDNPPMTTLPAAAVRALQFLAFDGSGNPIASTPVGATTPVSTIMKPVVAGSTTQIARNALGVLESVWGGTTTGSANAQVSTLVNPPSDFALQSGLRIDFIPGFANTAATTLNVNGTGNVAFRKRSSAGLVALSGGEMSAAVLATATYDGTFWVIGSSSATLNGLLKTCAVNYTVLPADNGSTMDVTVKMVTVTFLVASGYAPTHWNIVSNSSGRRINVAVDGHTTFKLYPKQTAFILNSSGGWVVHRPLRYQTNFAGFTFYVDHANGSDTLNDGLAAGSGNAFATIQAAVQACETDLDCCRNPPAIQLANETFTEDGVVHTYRLHGAHVISITGDPVTPGNVIWQVSAGQTGWTARDWSGAILSGFKMLSLGSGSTGISVSQHGVTDIGNVEFGTFTAGICIQSTNGGSVGYSIGGTSKFLGNAAQLWNVSAGSNLIISGNTINLSAITFTTGLAMTGGVCTLAGVTFTGAGAGAGSTGVRYGVTGNALLIQNAVTLPGASAGTTATGGQAI